jgi:hypothetical protein
VPEGVVDGLEAVEVQEEHRDRPAAGCLQRAVDELVKVGAVGQVGEVIVTGAPECRLVRLYPVGDVGVRGHHPAGVVDSGGLDVEPDGASVFHGDRTVVDEGPPVAGRERLEAPAQCRSVCGADVPGRGLVVVRPHTPKLGGLALALAEGVPLPIGGQDGPVAVEEDSGGGVDLEHGPQQL